MPTDKPAENSLMLVRKVSDLLDYLSRGESSAADIADAINEPRSSIYRLLSSLQTEGFVEAGSRRGQYRLGFKLLSLATAAVSRFDERKFALPVMERLHDLTGETVFLCVPRKDDAVCIERIEGMRVRSLALQLGGALPLHAGAAPRAILAHLPEAQWDAYIERNAPLQRFTDSTPVEPAELRAVLTRTRDDGLAVSDQDVTVGVAAIGVPITDYRGQIRGALSISGIRESILGGSSTAWREELIRGGREISEALGAELASEGLANFG
ncbi:MULTISPECIES: IclR family transcriptional regulator [Mycolicibacterium]|uniref:IclR family transcriptional regulator n=1 Tax=Mycolicibacterium wolinskyi TaxID=59750 RepID=A0A1X2FH88_9MYCO|nr:MULTISPECIES: IclR family transcriptional regulator [Mycolicibacterium]ORX17796.1 IclR family transcriptional regulator [Mycolicibacterium wolinskyi]